MLAALRLGDPCDEPQLLAAIYDELRRLARYYTRLERRDHTLNSTALVHEAYLKLVAGGHRSFEDRVHFFALASRAMRQILVDHARYRLAGKRGAGAQKVELDAQPLMSEERPGEVVALDEAIDRLAEFAPRQAEIVEMRFFGGMTEEEIAGRLGLSVRTVRRNWSMARSWLFGELKAS